LKANVSNHPFARFLGVSASLALAVLLATLSIFWIDVTRPPGLGGTNGFGAAYVMVFGLALAAVLLALLIGVSIYLRYKKAAGKALMLWMWLPVLAASAVYPVHIVIDRSQGDHTDRRG
jgi:hypothetical protein